MAKELEGNVAAVTGGASGIGLASTEAMLAAGARVVLVDRDEAALHACGGSWSVLRELPKNPMVRMISRSGSHSTRHGARAGEHSEACVCRDV